MGWALNYAPPKVVRSTAYPSCWYCEACQATFPDREATWEFRSYNRHDTSGDYNAWGGHVVPAGQCPLCGRKAEK